MSNVVGSPAGSGPPPPASPPPPPSGAAATEPPCGRGGRGGTRDEGRGGGPNPGPLPLTGKTVVLGVGGSIAAYKAADLCSKLVQAGARVLPVLTAGARRFVTPATFGALAAQPVSTDTFEEPFGPEVIAHLHYAEVADLILVAPASADLMARLAAGGADDMLTSLLLARADTPVLIAPAMNTHMWAHPATRRNRATLEGFGYGFLEPGVGRLAEGIVGAGRMAEPAEILEAVTRLLSRAGDLAGLRVLVTAGPTREPVDPVRYLTNRSSGKMGYAVAEAAAARGAAVTLVTGPTALPIPAGVEAVRVETAAQMAEAGLQRAEDCDVVVQAAAVADFRPANPADRKIKKGAGFDAIALEPTQDIAAALGARKRPGQTLVGFAAETDAVEANARKKIANKNLDLIVANDVTAPGAGFEVETNVVTFLTPDGVPPEPLPQMPKRAVADALWDRVLGLRQSTAAEV